MVGGLETFREAFRDYSDEIYLDVLRNFFVEK